MADKLQKYLTPIRTMGLIIASILAGMFFLNDARYASKDFEQKVLLELNTLRIQVEQNTSDGKKVDQLATEVTAISRGIVRLETLMQAYLDQTMDKKG